MLNTFRAKIIGVSVLWLECAFAALCFGSTLGLFDKDTTVAPGQFAGHADFNPSTSEYSLAGGGGEISGKADSFQYLWKRVTGDLTVNANVRFTGAGFSDRSQAAIMVRQSLDPDAAYAAALLYGDGRGGALYRVDKGASSRSSDFSTTTAGIVHLFVRRQGDAFTIAVGRTGKSGGSIPFTEPITVTMNGPVYVGLAVGSAEDPKRQMAAVFSNVLVQGQAVE